MHVLHCDRCHLDFFDHQGYEIIKKEGTVCMDCILEAEDNQIEEEQQNAKIEANKRG